jgi:hypothetical protein
MIILFTVVAGSDLASYVDIIEYPKKKNPSYLVPSLDQPELDHLSLCYQVSFARYGIARTRSCSEERHSFRSL